MDSSELAEKLTAAIRKGAAADAVVLLSLEPDSAAGASAMSAAVTALYRDHRDVANMVLAAHVGATWCLGQAALQVEAGAATELMRRARAMCFNAAANCWPGWADEGAEIDDADVAAGLGLAAMCRALSQELALGPEAQGTSHWLVGALELARGDTVAARAAFAEAARAYAALGAQAPQTAMVRGYDALAAKDGVALNEALERLHGLGTDEARFFAEQIRKAGQVFDARSRAG